MRPDGGAGQGAGALARPRLALNGVCKDFSNLRQADPACPELPDPLGNPVSPAGDLCLCLGEHVPVVLRLLAQDYIRSTVPLDGSSPMEVSAIPPPAAGGPFPGHHHEDYKHPAHPDLIVAPELFADQRVGGLLMGPTGVVLQSLRGAQVGPEPRPPPPPPTRTHTHRRYLPCILI